MRATELIQRLSTARVESVRFVNGDNKGAPGVYAILISDYQA